MIPNVFVSSTIADLQYLRDAFRDAIIEVSYNPVMSEHGGVGYIYNGTAADACCATIENCHIAVLILGKRYGNVGPDGLSVTHREFRAARAFKIPLITFVDGEVMTLKKFYDADKASSTWERFEQMDRPRDTFKFVDEVSGSRAYNGLVEFRSASEAKTRLKQQLAHLMCDQLSASFRRMKTVAHDILDEVKSLKNLLVQNGESGALLRNATATDPTYATLRFLLAERNNEYTKFVEAVFEDLDIAANEIQGATSIEEVVKKAGATIEVLPDSYDFAAHWTGGHQDRVMKTSSQSTAGSWALTSDKHVYLSESMRTRMNEMQSALLAKLR